MTQWPVLYSFRRCPYAMRARLALVASETRCWIREVKLSAKPDAMIAASPKATVPVLVLPDASVIDESVDIMRWALARNDPQGWGESDDRALIAANDGPFKYHLDRYKYPDRHGSDPVAHREAGLAILGALEARLNGQAFLCGARPSLTDAAIMPFVRQFAATDRAWFDALSLSGVQAWLGRYARSAVFEAAMVRLVPWKDGDAPIAFPVGAVASDASVLGVA